MSNDFKEPFELQYELKEGGHLESINSLDFSPGGSVLISSGNDKQTCVWDLRGAKGACVQKLTFRDKEFKSPGNFMMKGCTFSACGNFIYVLAVQGRYASFLIKYKLDVSKGAVQFSPQQTLEIPKLTGSGVRISKDGQVIAVTTSEGKIQIINEETMTTHASEKRH
mmetsp:Transcript_33437/g.51333  ORF Transcript_33437/g.51333 Transcript_33437/m.51333 type:complete len:167 (+) Transcript_33437:456-956(+)